MQKEENGTKEAAPVMKRLARPMSQKELQNVTGATEGCAPSYGDTHAYRPSDPPDYAF
jgi:hypothetical protein